jgi:PAS domain S-box-containing protein
MAWRSSPEALIGTKRWDHIGKPILRLAVCIATVFAVTAVLYAVPLHDRGLTASLTFLIVVLIVSAFWGFRYAVFVLVLTALGFSWLLPPIGHFWLSDSHDVFTLAAFLVIGITAGHFSDRARREALNANLRRAEAVAAEERFRDLVNSVEGIVWEADAATLAFLFVSDQAEYILGYPAERWLDEPTFWKDHLHPEDSDLAVHFYEATTARKRKQDFEYRMIAADGRVVWLHDLVTVVVENGRASRLRGVMTDVTERRRAQQVRQELEEQWKAAFESNPTMYFIVDEAGLIASVNGYGAEQLGYTVSELVGQPVLNVFYEPDRRSVQGHANTCFEQPGRTMKWEARKIRKDGTMLWVRETANAVLLKNRPVLLVICENITEQKRAEEAARRSESELRDLIESVPAMVFMNLPGPSNVFVSRRWREYTGMSSENTAGSGWQSVAHPDDLERHMEKWRVCSATGEPFEDEARFRRAADRQYRWFLVRAVALCDEHGNILKWYGVLTDIEDRKRAEALLTGEKRILEMVAKGDSLAQILDGLCRIVEEQASGVLASILLVDGNRLRHGGAPSLPKAYTDAIDGVVIGPSVGSCGTAAYRGEQVLVEDIATDPLWADYREAALPHSLRACWSTPVFSSQGKVTATFAMYYREPRNPSSHDQEIIEQITHLAGVAIERKQTQEALRRSEAYLAEAQKLTRTGSWAFSPVTRKTLYWSDELFRLWGFDPQLGPPDVQAVLQRIHPEDRERMRELSERGFDGHLKVDVATDHRIVLPDGTVKFHHGIMHPVFDEAGEVDEYIGTAIDVTERKEAEEALQRSEAYLAESQRLTKTGSWAYNPFTGKTLYWSDEMCRIFGLGPQERPSSEKFWQLVHPEDLDRVRERVEKEAHLKLEYVDEYRIVPPDGTIKHILDIGRPVYNAAGEVVEFVGTTVDITERKRAEEALRRSETYLTEAQRLTKTGSWAYDPVREKLIHFSEELYRIFGVDPQKGSPTIETLLEQVHPEDRDRVREISFKDHEKGEHVVDYRLRLPDGMVKYIHSIRHPVLNDAGETVELVGTTIDVTEQKRAEEELRAAETRFRTYVDHATDVLFVHDEQGKIVDMNRQACETLGYTREELIGAVPTLFDPNIDEISIQRLKERLEAGDLLTFESATQRKDGTTFPVEVRLRPFWHGGHRFALSLARDISERKRGEQERERLRQMEEDLAHINRVSMMGELTASLAHEIKQPIAAAVSNAEASLQWLARDQPDLVEVREAAREMVKEARRAAEIMTRVRSLFKKDGITREVLDLNEVITDTVSLVREEADRSSISVRTELDTELARIAADRVQLQQVLLNLMLNGLEAMKGARGELIIRSQQGENGRPLISVSDAGIGLPVGEGDRIFDAFFTTKPQGTGMGLAISRSIVESHGGRLWATANSGQGATFYFTLPNEVAEGA